MKKLLMLIVLILGFVCCKVEFADQKNNSNPCATSTSSFKVEELGCKEFNTYYRVTVDGVEYLVVSRSSNGGVAIIKTDR